MSGTLFAALRSGPDLAALDLQLMFIEYPFFPLTGTDVPGGFSITVQAVGPRSRGRVTLTSPDPLAAPLIDPAFFAHGADMDAMLRGVRLARELSAAKAFDSLRTGRSCPAGRRHQGPAAGIPAPDEAQRGPPGRNLPHRRRRVFHRRRVTARPRRRPTPRR